MNPLLMVWNLEEVVLKTFAHFYKEILMVLELQEAAANPLLMVWNLQKVAVNPFTHFYNELCMVLEASGGCCESIVAGLESLGGCCETICANFQ